MKRVVDVFEMLSSFFHIKQDEKLPLAKRMIAMYLCGNNDPEIRKAYYIIESALKKQEERKETYMSLLNDSTKEEE